MFSLKKLWDGITNHLDTHEKTKPLVYSPRATGKYELSLEKESRTAFGGMSELELLLKIEIILDKVLTANRSVLKPSQELANFAMHDQERFLETLDHIWDTSIELSYQFCQHGVPSLRMIEEAQWQDWVAHILTVYDSKGIDGAVEEMESVEDYIARISDAPSTVNFEEISRILSNVITGLNGRSLKIEQNERSYTDTETLFLPKQISTFDVKEDNFALFKSIAVHQWAQTWFGTWRVDVPKVVADYGDKKRALRIFHQLETIRLDACIKRELPGIARAMRKMDPIWQSTNLTPEWKNAVDLLSSQGTTVDDSVQLLPTLYQEPDLETDPLYQGTMVPEEAMKVINARKEIEKDAFMQAYQQLENELNANAAIEKIEDQEETEKDRKLKLQQVDDEQTPEGYRYELEYNDEGIEAPEDLQELLESIQQDLGEIPDEYLEHGADPTSGDAEEEEDEDQEVSTDDLKGHKVFLYDEWDHSRQQYRKEFCQLREFPVEATPNDFVEKTLIKQRGLLKHLYRTFEALREHDRRIKKQPYGEDIDIDAIVEAYAEMSVGHEVDQNLFIKQKKVDRNIAVMFMIDMSGSTAGWVNEMEREALVLLCESLEILGDRYAIYGFSGRTHERCDLYEVKDFDDEYNDDVRAKIGNIQPKDYTRMGVAIRHLSKKLAKVEARTKLLITLSDGRPDDQDGYRGTYGIEDTRRALIESKFMGIHPFCITIDEEAQEYLQHMYGVVNFTMVDNVDKLPYRVSDIYRRITV